MQEEASLTILLVEDDTGHAKLVQRNLRRAGVVNRVVWVENGRDAVDYARSEGAHAGNEEAGPLVVLMDINMPVMDGVSALRMLKASEKTRRVPVIMLTTTDDPWEIERCYELGAGAYVAKPVEYEAFRDAVRKLGLFLQMVEVPPRGGYAGTGGREG